MGGRRHTCQLATIEQSKAHRGNIEGTSDGGRGQGMEQMENNIGTDPRQS